VACDGFVMDENSGTCSWQRGPFREYEREQTTCYTMQETDQFRLHRFMAFLHSMMHYIMIQMAISLVFALFILQPATASAYVAIFNAMRGNGRIRFKDFFSCFSCGYYCKLMLLSILLVLGNFGLSMLFILPGVWWSIATVFALPLHGEHRFLGACKSVSLSIKVANRNFCSILCFLFLAGLLQVAGAMCFGVGLIITIPVAFLASAAMYHHLIGVKGVAEEGTQYEMAQPVVMHDQRNGSYQAPAVLA